MLVYYERPAILESLIQQIQARELALLNGWKVTRHLAAETANELFKQIDEFKEPCSVHGSIERFADTRSKETERIGWDLVLDIDHDNFEKAKELCLQTCYYLDRFGVTSYRIKFSGSRGFHVIVDGSAFDVDKYSASYLQAYPKLPLAVAIFIERCMGIKGVFDRQVYQRNKVIRLAYSLHLGSNLVSVPVERNHIQSFECAFARPDNVKTDLCWSDNKTNVAEAQLLVEKVQEWIKKERPEPFAEPKQFHIDRGGGNYSNSWIESLLKHGIEDGRHRAIMYVIAPYLLNVRNASIESALSEISDWIARCNSVKHVNADIIHFAKYNLRRVATQKKIKFYSRLARIQEEDPQLYSLISKAIDNAG